MNFLCILSLITSVSGAAPTEAPKAVAPASKAAYVGTITCYSDSLSGTQIAEAAATFLASKGQEKNFSKSYVLSDVDEKELNRTLILILTDDGSRAYRGSGKPFEENMLALLDRMKQHYGDNRVSVILQQPDKSNIIEASYDEKGTGAVRSMVLPTIKPAPQGTPPASLISPGLFTGEKM